MACLLPWYIKDQDKHPAIKTIRAFPEKLNEFRTYMQFSRPKDKKDNWFRLHIATNIEPVHLTSTETSDTSDYFDSMDGQAFLTAVQGSDDPVSLGIFMYSGAFLDHVRLENEVRKAIPQYTQKKIDFAFGFRSKKNKALEYYKNHSSYRPWVMAENQPIHVEVDKHQATAFKRLLYGMYNATEAKCPGGYNIRLLPDQSMMRSGRAGTQKRIRNEIKHQQVVHSLILVTSADISDLDKPFTANGNEYTLRGLVMDMTFPLVPKQGTKGVKLFHLVDMAPSGKDALQGLV